MKNTNASTTLRRPWQNVAQALLLLVYLGSVVILQQLFAVLTGASQNELLTILTTLGIAALVAPLWRAGQKVVDRRF